MHEPTAPSPPLAEHLRVFGLLHGAMRRDARRLAAAVDRLPANDPTAAEPLRRWFDAFREALGHHHRLEDDHFWPALRTHPDGPGVEAAMHGEHERLDRALEDVAASFDDPNALRQTVDVLADVLADHLAHEERTALALLGTHLSPAAFAAVDRQAHRAAGLRYVAFALPWLLDDLAPRDAEALRAATPRPFRLLLRVWWQPRYRRLTRAVRP